MSEQKAIRNVQVKAAVTPDEKQRIEMWARKHKVTVSATIRDYLLERAAEDEA